MAILLAYIAHSISLVIILSHHCIQTFIQTLFKHLERIQNVSRPSYYIVIQRQSLFARLISTSTVRLSRDFLLIRSWFCMHRQNPGFSRRGRAWDLSGWHRAALRDIDTRCLPYLLWWWLHHGAHWSSSCGTVAMKDNSWSEISVSWDLS